MSHYITTYVIRLFMRLCWFLSRIRPTQKSYRQIWLKFSGKVDLVEHLKAIRFWW